jgi:hypothetical protein
VIKVILAGEGKNELGGFADIERAIGELNETTSARPRIIGGIAIEKLESWVAAIAGIQGSEELRRPEEKLGELGVGEKDTAAMVQFVEGTGLGKVPADARSLRRWLDRARHALGG